MIKGFLKLNKGVHPSLLKNAQAVHIFRFICGFIYLYISSWQVFAAATSTDVDLSVCLEFMRKY